MDPTLVQRVRSFRERAGSSPGLDGLEFRKRTGAKHCSDGSDFGEIVWGKEQVQPRFTRFGLWVRNTSSPGFGVWRKERVQPLFQRFGALRQDWVQAWFGL